MPKNEPAASTLEPAQQSLIHLGKRLRSIRLDRQLTQGDVAKDLFSISYISGVERGQIRPSLGALERLAERLQVPITDLISEGDVDIQHPSAAVDTRERAAQHLHEEIEGALLEAHILIEQHRWDEGVAVLLHLERQHLSPHEAATVYVLLATCYNEQGRAEEARQVSLTAIPLSEQAGEQEMAVRLRSELGWSLSLLHDDAGALEQYQAVEQAIQEQVVQDPTFQLDTLMRLGSLYASQGESEQAIAVLVQAVEVAQHVRQWELLGSAYWSISHGRAEQGDPAGAKDYTARSLGVYTQDACYRLVAAMYNRFGMVLARTGQSEAAVGQLKTADALAAAQLDLEGQTEAESNLARIYLEAKRTRDAEQVARQALLAAERLMDARLQARALLVLARVQEVRKQRVAATESYERALELLQSLPATMAAQQLGDACAQFSEFLERHGETDRAFEILKRAYKATHGS
jgi:tetratricopeptide (TPR) repeat protein